jgi:endonuclease G, mitochondrial
MINWTAYNQGKFRQVLLTFHTSNNGLRRFVRDNLQWNDLDRCLNQLPNAENTNREDWATHLLEQLKADGWISELYLVFCSTHPTDQRVLALKQELGDPSQARTTERHQTSNIDLIDQPFDLPESYTDEQLEAWLPPPASSETDYGKYQRAMQRAANAVCKVSFTDRAATGTGVLISPDLVLTNYHTLSKEVIQDRAQLQKKAQTMLFEFGFVSEEDGTPVSPDTFEIDARELIICCSPPSQLDYALLRVSPSIKSYECIQPVMLSPEAYSLSAGDGLNILQHPEGNLMQASLSASGVVKVDKRRGRVWYVNRTMNGSSGSPCFNNDWEMVALHHASMSRGFGSIREGILLTSILAKISGFLV